jgi:hypothetical protein
VHANRQREGSLRLVKKRGRVATFVCDIAATWSLNRKGMRVYWSGAMTRRVAVYENDVQEERTRNDGRSRDGDQQQGETAVFRDDRCTTDCPGILL